MSNFPEQIWAPWQANADPVTGMAPFGAGALVDYGVQQGLPENWRPIYNATIDRSNAWNVVGDAEVEGNPLFAVAANALGLNWEQWRADTIEAIGEYDVNFRNIGDEPGEMDGWWGLGQQFNHIKSDLTDMQNWLVEVNKEAGDQPPTQGNPAEMYGMSGNIYEALGLTQAPDAPRELAVTYEGTYPQLKTSSAMYHKPSDRYEDIQLHEDRDGTDIENWRHGPGTYRSTYQEGRTEGTWMADTDHLRNPTEIAAEEQLGTAVGQIGASLT